MSFLAIVAFCAVTSAGPNSPAPPFECVWVENGYEFQSETGCILETQRLAKDPIINRNANVALLAEGIELPDGKVYWYTFCQPPEGLKDFYRHFGVGDLGDIPEDV